MAERIARRIGAAALGLALVPCLSCVLPGPAFRSDRELARPGPAAWKRLAVLPFAGAPDLRRPAAELLAVRVREQDRVAVTGPFAVERALAAAPAGEPAPQADRWETWVAACADAEEPLAPGACHPPAEEVRALAARLGADVLVAGAIGHEPTWWVRSGMTGAVVRLVLLDGASGEPVAVVRRQGDSSAAAEGAHELATDAAARAADDLREILRRVPAPRAANAVPEPPTSPPTVRE